jgi:hypothetical protein
MNADDDASTDDDTSHGPAAHTRGGAKSVQQKAQWVGYSQNPTTVPTAIPTQNNPLATPPTHAPTDKKVASWLYATDTHSHGAPNDSTLKCRLKSRLVGALQRQRLGALIQDL